MILSRMRIGSNNQVAMPQVTEQVANVKQQYQVKVLKKALDSQQDSATKLLKMLEPKGTNIDIKA